MNLQSKLVLSLQGYDDDQIDTMFTEEVDSAEKKFKHWRTKSLPPQPINRFTTIWKNIIENWHWTLEQVDNHDYYDLIDVFKANEDNKMASFDDLKKMFGQ